MKKINLFVLAIGLTLGISCNDSEKSAEASNKETPATSQSTPAKETTDSEVKVNPAHGLPGHRCDLPVGAPLNATAGSTSNPTPTSQLPSTSVSPIRVDQTPSVNPPHGEPGHDCAVPVGAPLEK